MGNDIEFDVIEDVRDFLINAIRECEGLGTTPVEGSELGYWLTQKINSDGSITYSREEAYNYLRTYSIATESTIKYMIEALGWDHEDIYYPDFAEEDELDGSYEAYIRWEGERVQVVMYIELANSMLAECSLVSDRWNTSIDMGDAEMQARLISELEKVDPSAVALEA